jgi:PAS domain S-box-containing protein
MTETREEKQMLEKLRESEAAYRTLAQNVPDIVYRVHLQGNRMQFFNDRILEITGFRPDELEKDRICSLESRIVDEDRQRVGDAVDRAIRSRSPFEVEYRFRHKNGSIITFLERAAVICDEAGAPLFIDGVILDITTRKQAEEEIAERSDMLQQIMDTASVAIFLVDMSGRITNANKRMAEMFGSAMQDLIGSEYVSLVHPSERDSGRTKMLALLASEIDSVDLERHYWRRDGTEFWGHLAGRRFYDVRGAERGLIGVITDITERRRVEEKLRENESRLNTILDNAGAAIFIKDSQYRYTYVNRKVNEILGHGTGEILGKSDEAFFSRVSVEEIMRSDRPVIEQGETVAREEAGLTTADGASRTYWTVKLPLRDSSGAITGLCGISTDITERKTAERALGESRRFLETIIESAPT